MGSVRLPGKVMLGLCGKTVLARVVERVRQSHCAGTLIVATSTQPGDEVIVDECRRLRVACFRGSQNDVLDRCYRAALEAAADVVVRICSDSPLTDPEVIDKVVLGFLETKPDYTSNTLHRSYPLGLDVEVITIRALRCCWKEARHAYQRSHVTPFVYDNPDRFKICHVIGEMDHSGHRWTLDTPEDYEFLGAIYSRMPDPDCFSWHDVLKLLDNEPELEEINQHIRQKELQAG